VDGRRFFHNGAFRQSYGYDYVLRMETSKKEIIPNYGQGKDGKPRDGFDYFLESGNFAKAAVRSHSKTLPTWKLFLNHPAYDSVWRSRGVEHSLNAVAVPTLSVGGYYDQEDMYGPQIEYSMLEPHDQNHQNFLVLAPGATAIGPRPRAAWATSTTVSPSAKSSAPRSRQSFSPTTSRMHLAQIRRASTSRTRQAFRPDRTPGSATHISARRIPANQSAPSGRGLA